MNSYYVNKTNTGNYNVSLKCLLSVSSKNKVEVAILKPFNDKKFLRFRYSTFSCVFLISFIFNNYSITCLTQLTGVPREQGNSAANGKFHIFARNFAVYMDNWP